MRVDLTSNFIYRNFNEVRAEFSTSWFILKRGNLIHSTEITIIFEKYDQAVTSSTSFLRNFYIEKKQKQRVKMPCCTFYHPRTKPVVQQIYLL